jgi:hypothetical protein
MGFMASRMLKLRRRDTCCVCATALAAGAPAWWDPTNRTVTCAPCGDRGLQPPATVAAPGELDRGHAGASVAREHQRRKRGREERTRKAHPRIGGLLLALRGAPHHEEAFRSGQLGEERLGAWLERSSSRGSAIVLHDRRMPSGYGNIDHLVIAPSGVFVIDAKNVRGKVQISAPLIGKAKLKIGGYNRTKLVDGLDRQVAAVRGVLTEAGRSEVPIQGVLCFLQADLPLLGTSKMRGHLLLSRRALTKRLNRDGPLDQTSLDVLARTLAHTLPPA